MQDNFKSLIVQLLLDGKTEEALELLAKNYGVTTPKLKIGLPKGYRRKVGCYTPKNQTISLLNSNVMGNPFVILHEFYHHLRTQSIDKQHKGTEKYANKFAAEFLKAYETAKYTQRSSRT